MISPRRSATWPAPPASRYRRRPSTSTAAAWSTLISFSRSHTGRMPVWRHRVSSTATTAASR
eukprot:3672453-Heterocapsa_arctica.AAC.1